VVVDALSPSNDGVAGAVYEACDFNVSKGATIGLGFGPMEGLEFYLVTTENRLCSARVECCSVGAVTLVVPTDVGCVSIRKRGSRDA